MSSLSTTTNPWLNSPSHSGHVSLGSHSLFLRTSGPPRIPLTPVAAVRLISTFARVYSYDRAGYGYSKPLSPSSLPLTSKKRCEELTLLLEKAGVEPPWIIVGHSYGGVLVREFSLMHGKEKVVGMCIVDSAVTRTKLPDSWPTLLGEASYEEVVGLEENRVLSDEEWAAVKADGNGILATVEEEEKEMPESTRSINEKVREGGQLLGNGRLSVVFCDESVDFWKILNFAEEKGNGNEEAREALRDRLEDMGEIDEKGQKVHLVLSSTARFVRAEGVARTHNVQFVKPELIADEVKWVFEGVEQ